MSINLAISFDHPAAIAHRVRYARIDNLTSLIVYTTIVPDPTSSPAVIATNIPNGQYRIGSTPIYADGRSCNETVVDTAACPLLNSINAYVSGSNLVVTYLAPATVPKVRITVNYPNGGSYVANYVNTGDPITIPLPVGVSGDFSISGQSVCDEGSGFYSAFSSQVTVIVNGVTSGNYRVGNSTATLCNNAPVVLYTSGPFQDGSILYTDAGLTTPQTGFTYVVDVSGSGTIFNLNTSTGLVGSDLNLYCGSLRLENSLNWPTITAVNNINGFTLTGTVAPFATQEGTHDAFTAAIEFTISGTSAGSNKAILRLNGTEIDCVDINASGTFTFASATFVASDSIIITLMSGAC